MTYKDDERRNLECFSHEELELTISQYEHWDGNSIFMIKSLAGQMKYIDHHEIVWKLTEPIADYLLTENKQSRTNSAAGGYDDNDFWRKRLHVTITTDDMGNKAKVFRCIRKLIRILDINTKKVDDIRTYAIKDVFIHSTHYVQVIKVRDKTFAPMFQSVLQ